MPEEEKALGLVREHDYAVMDLKSEEGSRLLLIKNPWCDSLIWTGVGSSATLKTHTAGSTSDGASNQFWMAFEDVQQHFDSLYVNWNPALFTHRQDHHFKWEASDKTEELVFTHNPQYSVLSPSRSPIWVLLSRHWQDGELEILRARKAEKDHSDSTLAHVSKQLGFVSLAVYATSPSGSRIPISDGHHALHQGPYVDSPNTLLRYTPTPGIAQTLVVSKSELPLPTYSFTLSFFSTEPLTISPAPEPLPHSVTVRGAWTRRTAGGSAAHATYFTNPQYALTLPRATPLSLILSTDIRDLPVHVALVFSPGGRRITGPVHPRDVLASSLEYQRGCTSASVPRPALVDAGTYTVVVSTFEPGQTGNFALRICAAEGPIELKPVLSDAAGRLRTAAPRVVVFGHQGQERLRARVAVGRLTRLGVLARSAAAVSSAPAAMVRIALELGTGPHRRTLAVSGGEGGEFADLSMGLRTDEVDVEPEVVRASGGLWVVVEQIGGDGGNWNGGVQVEVLSDAVVQLGGWENADE